MATLKIFRETALPGTLQPDSLYVVAPASQPNYFELYVVNTAGSVRRIIDQDAIQSMINTSIQAASQVQIVANIAARNALTPTTPDYVFVVDATSDSTVNSGGATYIYNPATTSWIKVSEAESLDVQLTWSALQGKPNSTPTQIDQAVSLMHSHSNKTQLDLISQDASGNLTYSGSLPHIGWDSTNW